MRLTDPRKNIEINTENLEARLAESLQTLRDERIVKPRQVKISDIDPEKIMNGIFVHSDEEVDLVKACNVRILWGTPKYAEGYEAGYDAILKPVIPIQTELVHQSPIFIGRSSELRNDRLIENRVIGDPNFEIFGKLQRIRGNPTYLKEEGTDKRNYLGGGNELIGKHSEKVFAYWQFHISIPELLKTRNIFFDPEGTSIKVEYKKTYLVFGGIPLQSIKKAKIVINN